MLMFKLITEIGYFKTFKFMKMIRRNNFSTTFYFLFPNAQKTIHAEEDTFRNIEEY